MSAYKIEETEYSDMDGKILVGPEDFECILGEPEDCSWYRAGSEAMVRLNEQHAELESLRGIVTRNFYYSKGALYDNNGLMASVADSPDEDDLLRKLFKVMEEYE
jgi:hypothetical protein